MDELISALSRSVPHEVRTISRVLADAKHRSWVVGGAVRDVVMAVDLGRAAKKQGDFDLATDATPEQVKKLFRKVIPTGIEHGTVTVVLSGNHFEVTTLRGEVGHSDGRRPDEVFFVTSLEQDLARRDFTVNAMAFDVDRATFHDPFCGREDLKLGVLRAVGNPAERFAEDGLRVLRCARFAATLGLDIEEETATAIVPSLSSFEKVAQERVRDEWFKALSSNAPSRFLRAIHHHGMLEITAPRIFPRESDSQLPMTFDQTVQRVDEAAKDPVLRLAVFCWGGLPPSSQRPSPHVAELNSRFRLSRQEGARLTFLCDHARLPSTLLESPTPEGARRYLAEFGRERAPDALAMQRAVRPGTVEAAQLERAHEFILTELSSDCPLSTKDLAISGADLMNEAGIAKGPRVGQVLSLLLDHVLADPGDNQREVLLRLARAAG